MNPHESMSRRPRRGGNEQDAFSKWGRRFMVSFQRAGVAKATKQIHNRRVRRQGRARDWLDEIFDFTEFDCE